MFHAINQPEPNAPFTFHQTIVKEPTELKKLRKKNKKLKKIIKKLKENNDLMIKSVDNAHDVLTALQQDWVDGKYAVLEHTDIVITCHSRANCKGEFCAVHTRSQHNMRKYRQHWRPDRGIMERICSHGVGHPDDDDITDDTTHGCDGCCRDVNDINPQFTGIDNPYEVTTESNENLTDLV